MKTTVRLLVYAVLVAFLVVACKKNEGKGGKLSIKGKVRANYYNKTFKVLRYSNYAPDEDVFIMYGDENINGDDTKTSYDGNFEFNFLNKGKYKIYTYSIDTATLKKVAVIREIDLTEDVTLEDLHINMEDKTTGTFSIRGKVLVNDYDDTYTFVDGPPYYAIDEDVFIIEEGDSSYFDKVTTNYDGMYEFKGLRKGKYKLYVLSEGDKAIIPGGHEAVIKNVEIVDNDLMLTDFNIIKN